jgi:hypothetical protein
MQMVSERLGSAVASGRCGVEIGAAGVAARSNPLGVAVARLRCGNDAPASNEVLRLLLGVLQLRAPRSFCEVVAKEAMREYLLSSCRACKGAGWVPGERAMMKLCMVCSGLKIRRYSDSDRAQAMGLDVSAMPKYGPHVDKLIEALATAESQAVRVVSRQLAA